MISAVVVPLLVVSVSTVVLIICKRYGHCDRDIATGTDQEGAGRNEIKPYAAVYIDSTELRACDRNVVTARRPLPASEDNRPIQPYAVRYGDTPEDTETISPYAVAYNNDQDNPYAIQPYAVTYADNSQSTGGQTEAGGSVLDNITDREKTKVKQPVSQSEGQSAPLPKVSELVPCYENAPERHSGGPNSPDDGNSVPTGSDTLYRNDSHNGGAESNGAENDDAPQVLYNTTQDDGQSGAENNDVPQVLYNTTQDDGQPGAENNDAPHTLYNTTQDDRQPGAEDNVASHVLYNTTHDEGQSE